MDERKKRVLHAIVQDYISTAEPVGSRTIARKYDLGVSPATIRNEMADLEDLGYIEQPHTSAGRIPSDKGYRFYVDCIMGKHKLSTKEEKFISSQLSQRMEDIEKVIANASRVLSKLSNYTAMVVGPLWNTSIFNYVKMLPMENNKALLVIVNNIGNVEHKIIDLPPSITERDLERISYVLNSKLQGFAIEEVKKHILNEIYSELIREKFFVKTIFEIIENTLANANNERVFLDGTVNILNQPEFKDIEKVRNILSILEEKDILVELIGRDKPRGLTIKIGEENKVDGIKDCSLITATYEIDDEIIGSIGILGPTRMQYSKSTALVEYITEILSVSLSRK